MDSKHVGAGKIFLWSPPPVIADAALEECLKAVHKRQDLLHIFVVPRLFTPQWRRLFYKFSDFIVRIPVGSPHWPSSMHEPVWIGISLPFVRYEPWSLRGAPLLVELDRKMRSVLRTSKGDGGNILRELLRIPRRLQAMPERVARGVLHLPGKGTVPNGGR